MTFDCRLVGFDVENLEMWPISYGINNFSYPPTCINSIDFTKGNFDVAGSCRWVRGRRWVWAGRRLGKGDGFGEGDRLGRERVREGDGLGEGDGFGKEMGLGRERGLGREMGWGWRWVWGGRRVRGDGFTKGGEESNGGEERRREGKEGGRQNLATPTDIGLGLLLSQKFSLDVTRCS